VWKTVDGGVDWRCVSDGFFSSAAIGALAVSGSDPEVIYPGTGETEIQLDVSYGDGVYKSTDAGRTWSHLGLRETRFIGRIQIHPRDPDLVYVAALGDAFGANEERGVFRSRDGGKTWNRMLYRDTDSGAVDLSMDPQNPRILFGPSGRRAGTSGTFRAAGRGAASSAPPTAAKPGPRSRAIRGCLRAPSASSALPYRRHARAASGRWSRRKRRRPGSTDRRITATAGLWFPRIAI
jgi:hypothetical protein